MSFLAWDQQGWSSGTDVSEVALSPESSGLACCGLQDLSPALARPSPPWPTPHCAPVHTPCLQLPVGTLGGSFKHPMLFVKCLPFSWVPAAPRGSLAQVFKLISEFSQPGILPEASLTLPGWLPLFRVPCVCFNHCA